MIQTSPGQMLVETGETPKLLKQVPDSVEESSDREYDHKDHKQKRQQGENDNKLQPRAKTAEPVLK